MDQFQPDIRALAQRCMASLHAPTPFIPGVSRIPYAGRVFDEDELAAAVEASLEFWLTEGRFARTFEERLTAFHGLSHAILVNSGSSANLVAVATLMSPRLGTDAMRPGDEVITVAAAFPTTVAAIVQNQLIPVFVDVDIGQYNAIPQRIAQAVGPRTRAIMLAHTMGNPVDLEAVCRIAKEHGLWIIEDNCDALGSRYGARLTGTFGHLATCSFYPAHHITTGEGGCVLTDDSRLAEVARSIRDWGRDCHCRSGQDNACGHRFSGQFGALPQGYDHRYVFSNIGFNFKLTDIQAAIGAAQMNKLPAFIDARKKNWNALREGIAPLEDHFVLPQATPNSDPAWFGFVLTVRESAPFSRADVVSHLESRRIETRNLFAGNLLRHPGYCDIPHRIAGDLAGSDAITERTFFIGCYPGLTSGQIDYIIESFKALP